MNKLPKAIGPYATHRKMGQLIVTSGQLPIDPAENKIVAQDIEGQTRQSLENVKSVLAVEGYELTHVMKATIYLSDITNFEKCNQIYATYFSEPYPARTAFEVVNLPQNALIEIEVQAYK